MGTAESRPEPLIDHLRQALSHPQGHRWMQVHLSDWKGWSLAPRPPLRADSQGGRLSIWKSLPCGFLLWAHDMGKFFISLLFCKCDNLSGPMPSYLTICIPDCHTGSTIYTKRVEKSVSVATERWWMPSLCGNVCGKVPLRSLNVCLLTQKQNGARNVFLLP